MNLKDMIDWLRTKVGCGYVYGGFGQICTQELLDDLRKRWGDRNYELAKKWIGKQVYDCVNLIKCCYRDLGGPWVDVSADGLFRLTNDTRPLTSAQEGDLLFRLRNGRAEHVGVALSPYDVLEARSTMQGVVISPIRSSEWTFACTNPWLTTKFSSVIQRAVSLGVMNSPQLWQDYLDGKKPVNPEYLKILMTRYNDRL